MTEETKEQKPCCCGHEHEGGKCCCKYKKFFPHNWFKLKCLTHIFNVFFYICAIFTIYVLVTLIIQLAHMSWAEMKDASRDILQAVSGWFVLVISTFVMLAVAKICKALRKVKRILKNEFCAEDKKASK